MNLKQSFRNILFGFATPMRCQELSKGALIELMRASTEKFERMIMQMHFTEKKFVSEELFKRVNILGGSPIG